MASRVGKKQSTIANKLRLLRLPQAVREALRKNSLTERHARVLLKLPTEAEQPADHRSNRQKQFKRASDRRIC